MTLIRTPRLQLRTFQDADLEAFALVLADPGTMAPWGSPYGLERSAEELSYYLDHYERYGFAPLAIVHEGNLVGDMGLQHLEDGAEVELLYRLSSTVWRRGLGTEAGDAILDYGFTVLGLDEIVAVISENNIPSQRLATKLGFTSGEPGTYYGQRLVRHHITEELHTRSVQRRKQTTV